ncbi:MAG: adenylate kinase [Desulfurococcales archaeon]|nr:adenylate kinase [Desulfurococcales archaeon]
MRHPFRVVVVTGIPGVGKTTVLTLLEEEARKRNVNLMIANYGTYMVNTAIKIGLVDDRDQLRKLPLRNQLELQVKAAESIISDASERLDERGYLIIDTHSVVKTVIGYWPGLPNHVLDVFKPDLIVLIEAQPEVIWERQRRDTTRKRNFGGVEDIKELIWFARSSAMASAVRYASAVAIVENPEGNPDKAVEDILRLMNKI